jgi:hypothetical protein
MATGFAKSAYQVVGAACFPSWTFDPEHHLYFNDEDRTEIRHTAGQGWWLAIPGFNVPEVKRAWHKESVS